MFGIQFYMRIKLPLNESTGMPSLIILPERRCKMRKKQFANVMLKEMVDCNPTDH
jgi:hypothetical protein